ncbi:hypothetical protein AVEN_48958-1 [Araneus ventricosus]|uniref:Uncharacterized protein n=1 Tax=Araneus ventricosus TaxID=182803 RepID=A0A4Y2AI70_ARAVE|nr:hypothetical protein AVEN_48958-1 [Araneus ventricosus]
MIVALRHSDEARDKESAVCTINQQPVTLQRNSFCCFRLPSLLNIIEEFSLVIATTSSSGSSISLQGQAPKRPNGPRAPQMHHFLHVQTSQSKKLHKGISPSQVTRDRLHTKTAVQNGEHIVSWNKVIYNLINLKH